jgi:competence protein ComEA
MSNPPSQPGQAPSSSNTSNRGRLARFFSFIVRPVFFICILAILIGIGTLVSSLAAVKNEKAAAVPTAEPVKTTPTAKAGLSVPTSQPDPTPDRIIKIFITGEVVHPGVYEMQEGDRIIDAVRVAGGFSEAADPDRIDQAQRVRDEMRIEIPRRTPSPQPGATPDPSLPTPAQSVTPAGQADTRLNINTASATDLDKLPGIGETLSQRIVDYRVNNGPFRSLDDVRKVPGLNNSVIEKIKDLIIF